MIIKARRRWTGDHAGWISFLLLPPIAVMAVFVAWPLLSALSAAFFRWHGLARGEFVGLQNFADVLFGDHFGPITWRAFRHNIFVFAALLVVQNTAGFFLAWLIYIEPFGYRLHRTAVFLPVILSTALVGFMWKLFLDPNFGLVNQGLAWIGLGALQRPWLGQEGTALSALVLANAWHWVGFPTLVYLAGMQRIPRDILDAAKLDGCGVWRTIRNIVWPLVAPSTTVTFTLLFIGAFNWFELPYIMAGIDGSPYGSTDVLGLYFYRTAFGNQSAGVQDFGRGNALAALMFIFIAGVATFITLQLRKREIAL
ncbi:sugar ABC transporter permease [Terrarubrum flagellatum]|uniref:carbohydrate ABC transporter permease n=1 Tax=Terrirubrum flagellatum TaxID=2895980 RepID=UPI00314504ED